MNEDIMRAMGFGSHLEDIKMGKCPLCKKKINIEDFRDQASLKEFEISKMCQECQDKAFGTGE